MTITKICYKNCLVYFSSAEFFKQFNVFGFRRQQANLGIEGILSF